MTREDVNTSVPNLTIRFNEQVHTEGQIREFLKIVSPYMEVHAAKDYTFSIELPVVITLIIAVPIWFFAKGFFTKLGEKLGEEAGEDAVRAYKRLKETLSRALNDKAGKKEPRLRFEVLSENEPPEVHAKVESYSARDLEEAIDKVEELMGRAAEDAREIRESTGSEVIRSHYRYNLTSRSWEMTYAITRNQRIVSFEDE